MSRLLPSSLAVLAVAGFGFAQEPKKPDVPTAAATPAAKEKAPPAGPSSESLAADLNYIIGQEIVANLKAQNVELDAAQLTAGIKDAIDGKASKFDAAAAQAIKTKYGRRLADPKGTDYQMAELKREGVKSTASGLLYEVQKEGTGNKPKITDTVSVHYKGTLIDGTEFDSSYSRNMPTEFPLNGVIKGWTEGLQLMTQGSKYRFVIPSDLAYGQSPPPGKIAPNSTLVFEVELLSIKEPGK